MLRYCHFPYFLQLFYYYLPFLRFSHFSIPTIFYHYTIYLLLPFLYHFNTLEICVLWPFYNLCSLPYFLFLKFSSFTDFITFTIFVLFYHFSAFTIFVAIFVKIFIHQYLLSDVVAPCTDTHITVWSTTTKFIDQSTCCWWTKNRQAKEKKQ